MILLVTNRYSSGYGGPWAAGQELHVSDDLGAQLLRDSPGSFTVVGELAEDTPTLDRRMRGGRRR